jgi:hypothetical protein
MFRAARISALVLGLFGWAPALCVVTTSHDASASIEVGVSLLDLVRASSAVAIVRPVERHSEWERGRIITLHRVRIESLVAGRDLGSEAIIETLGGTIGAIGQVVSGEPELPMDQPSLVFLDGPRDAVFRVSARAQGHFRVVQDRWGGRTLLRSRQVGTLIAPPGVDRYEAQAAVVALHGAPLEAALSEIALVWEGAHAR